MRSVSATEAQNRFGQLLDEAVNEEVVISKNGRERVVMLSVEAYRKLRDEAGVRPEIKTALERSMRRWDRVYECLAK